MDMLIELKKENKVVEIIQRNMDLFELFESIYLFGSVLNKSAIPNDIDILLVYTGNIMEVLKCISDIRTIFEKEIGLPVDLTILSSREIIETDFLKRINYLKVK